MTRLLILLASALGLSYLSVFYILKYFLLRICALDRGFFEGLSTVILSLTGAKPKIELSDEVIATCSEHLWTYFVWFAALIVLFMLLLSSNLFGLGQPKGDLGNARFATTQEAVSYYLEDKGKSLSIVQRALLGLYQPRATGGLRLGYFERLRSIDDANPYRKNAVEKWIHDRHKQPAFRWFLGWYGWYINAREQYYKVKYRRFELRSYGDTFYMVFAPTRAGKGVNYVIPILLEYESSLFCIDIKSENFLITSKVRAEKFGHEIHRVYVTEPRDYRTKEEELKVLLQSSRFNPIDYVKVGTDAEASHLKELAATMIEIKAEDDEFWKANSQSLFQLSGMLLQDLRTCGLIDLDYTFANMYRIITGIKTSDLNMELLKVIPNLYQHVPELAPDSITMFVDYVILSKLLNLYGMASGIDYGMEIVTNTAEGQKRYHCGMREETYRLVQHFSPDKQAPDTLDSMISTYRTNLGWITSPQMEYLTSASTFNLQHMRQKPMTVYLCVDSDKLQFAQPFIKLLTSLLIVVNADPMNLGTTETHQIPVLMLLDEFTAIGKVPKVASAVGYFASAGVRLFLIAQSYSQLKSVYGEEDALSIMNNIKTEVQFVPDNADDLDRYLKYFGHRTVKTISTSNSEKILPSTTETHSVSQQVQQGDLIRRDHLNLIHDPSNDYVLVHIKNSDHKPLFVRTAPYFKDKKFLNQLASVGSDEAKALYDKFGFFPVDQFKQLWNYGHFAIEEVTKADFNQVQVPHYFDKVAGKWLPKEGYSLESANSETQLKKKVSKFEELSYEEHKQIFNSIFKLSTDAYNQAMLLINGVNVSRKTRARLREIVDNLQIQAFSYDTPESVDSLIEQFNAVQSEQRTLLNSKSELQDQVEALLAAARVNQEPKSKLIIDLESRLNLINQELSECKTTLLNLSSQIEESTRATVVSLSQERILEVLDIIDQGLEVNCDDKGLVSIWLRISKTLRS